MCDLCEIVKKVVRGEEIEEEVLYKDGLCVAIRGKATGLPIFIRRYHETNPLKLFKEAMKQTAKRMFPDMQPDDSHLTELDHYHFYMRPKKEKSSSD